MSTTDAVTNVLGASNETAGVDIDTITTLEEAFRKIPNGLSVLRIATRLGLVTDSDKVQASEFTTRFSSLSDAALSDLSARVTARAAAFAEIGGLLSGMQTHMKARGKALRARVRIEKRDTWRLENPDAKKAPTLAELNDTVEQDARIIDHESQVAVIDMFAGMVSGSKEAHLLMKESISREITLRSEKIKARLGF